MKSLQGFPCSLFAPTKQSRSSYLISKLPGVGTAGEHSTFSLDFLHCRKSSCPLLYLWASFLRSCFSAMHIFKTVCWKSEFWFIINCYSCLSLKGTSTCTRYFVLAVTKEKYLFFNLQPARHVFLKFNKAYKPKYGFFFNHNNLQQ